MGNFLLPVFISILVLLPLEAEALVPIPPDPLSSFRPNHPRLLATAADFNKLKDTILSDPLAGKMAKAVIRQADGIVKDPRLPQHVLPDGKRLLATSRSVLNHMFVLGMAWQLTHNSQYPERAWKDLEAAGNFADWNPPHFLDTGEMTAAFGVGLDWMWDAWTSKQREQICQWILLHGIGAAMKGYQNPTTENGHQLRALNNWGQVTITAESGWAHWPSLIYTPTRPGRL